MSPVITPPYGCDALMPDGTACPNTFVNGVSFSILTQVNSPDPRLAGYACPEGQHQYCTWQHALIGKDQCFTNHLLPVRANEVATWNTAHPTDQITD